MFVYSHSLHITLPWLSLSMRGVPLTAPLFHHSLSLHLDSLLVLSLCSVLLFCSLILPHIPLLLPFSLIAVPPPPRMLACLHFSFMTSSPQFKLTEQCIAELSNTPPSMHPSPSCASSSTTKSVSSSSPSFPTSPSSSSSVCPYCSSLRRHALLVNSTHGMHCL